MKNFLHGSGAVAIGLIFASLLTFPALAVGVVVGWFFIQEHLEDDDL